MKKKSMSLYLPLILFLMMFSTSFSRIIYIPNEYGTIQEGINESVHGDTVLVEQGTYFENITFSGKAITVASGYIFQQNSSIIENTIINGSEDNVICFEENEDSLSVLCGFSIVNGSTGILCVDGSSPKIIDNFVFNNGASGIVCNVATSPIILRNNIYDNSFNGVYCDNNSTAEIRENTIYGNNYPNIWCGNGSDAIITDNFISCDQAANNGIYINNSSVLISNNSISNCGYPAIYIENSTGSVISGNDIFDHESNGIVIFTSTISISNNLISNCGYPGIYCGDNSIGNIVNNIVDESMWGMYIENQTNVNIIGNIVSNSPKDGIAIINSNPYLINNTIVNNGLDYPDCAGLYISGSSYPEVINSIMWNNAYDFLFYGSVATVTISSSITETASYPDQVIDNGANLLAIDPLFIDGINNNFGLQTYSPCIDSGTLILPDGVILPELDLLNNVRVYDDQIDIGACEWNPQISNEHNEISNVCENNLRNYPNPFNPSTTIEFEIQLDSFIDLTVFNIKGQKIKTLICNVYSKGLHSITWNGDSDTGNQISSGVYFYRLNVNGITVSKKTCLLLK